MLKTVQVIGAGKAGGAETFYLRFIQAMQPHMDVYPVVRQGSWVQQQLAAQGIEHTALPFGGLLDLSTRRRLREVIRTRQPQLVQYWMNRAARFADFAPGVLNIGRLGGYYSLKYYRRMHVLAGNTQDICRYVTNKGWPETRVVHLPNFAPRETFNGKREEARKQFGVPQESFVYLAAARLHPVKGLDVLMQAFARLPYHTRLLIAGEGTERDNLHQLAQGLGIAERVHFVGWQNNMAAAATAADAWVMPSRHEPLGNTVLDAWAYGLPLIATATNGPLELTQDEQNALLVPVEDAASLYHAMQRLLQSDALRETLAQNGAYMYAQNYAPQIMAERYLDTYKTLLLRQEAA